MVRSDVIKQCILTRYWSLTEMQEPDILAVYGDMK